MVWSGCGVCGGVWHGLVGLGGVGWSCVFCAVGCGMVWCGVVWLVWSGVGWFGSLVWGGFV